MLIFKNNIVFSLQGLENFNSCMIENTIFAYDRFYLLDNLIKTAERIFLC